MRNLIQFFCILLIFVLIIDPADLIFHLKTPLFFAILAVWVFGKAKSPIHVGRDIYYLIWLFIAIPVWGILTAIAQDNMADWTYAIGYFKSVLVFVLVLVTIDQRISMEKWLNRLAIFIPLIIIPTYITLIYSPRSFGAIYKFLAEDKDAAKFSLREFYGFPIFMLYYRTCPLLVFPEAYYLSKWSRTGKGIWFFYSGIFAFTLFLSGTRANILMAFVIFAYFLFNFLLRRKYWRLLTGLGILMVGFVGLFVLSLSFKVSDSSEAVKGGHFDSYITLFQDNPQYLLFGQGLGSEFYSTGFGYDTPNTELTYFEFTRTFGLPLALLVILVLIYPVFYLVYNRRITSENRHIVIAYFCYLFIAGTNPLLVSSTGILVLVVVYGIMAGRSNYESIGLHSNI